MAYIGAEPVPGQNREVDDISSSFNGSTTAFTLQVSGVNVSPESANNILVNLGGVLQNPGTDYTIAASTITFTTAPASGLSFFALVLGAGINTATVADQTIGPSKLIDTAVTAGSYTTADITVDAQGRITAASSGSISGAEIADQAVTNAKVNNSAAIAGTKISPDFGSQAISTTGGLSINGATVFNESGADVDFRIEGDTEANLFYVDASADRIGINTSSPNSKLNIFDGSDNDAILFVQGADTTSEYVSLGVQTGKAIVRGGGSGSTNTALAFEYSNAGTETEGMRIDSSGRLLIGTTSGSHTLTVSGDIATSGDILLTVDDEKIQLGASQDFLLFHNSDQNYVYGVGNHPMLFHTNNTERMRIHGNSNQLQIGGSTLINSDPYLTLGQSANSQGNVLHMVNNGSNDVKASFISAGKTSRAIGIDVSADTFNIFRDNSDIDFLITSTGNIGMVTSGSYSALGQLTIQHDGTRFGMCIHNTNGGGGNQISLRLHRNDSDVGSISTTSTATHFNTSSDYRLKENAVAIPDGIARIKQLLPKRFNWISDETNTMQDGFFAHEVNNVVPEAITGVKDAVATEDEEEKGIKKGDPVYQQIDQSKLVPLLTAALQEAITKIETLETKVAALEAA